MKNKVKSPLLNIGDRFISKINENEYVIVAIDTSIRMYAYVNVGHINDPLWINWSEFSDIEDKK